MTALNQIEGIVSEHTKIKVLTPENIVDALGAVGWNYTIYTDNSIFLKKVKITLSDSDMTFMRSGLPFFNEGKKIYRQITF